ncbi:MAG: BLUF domain-containing protein [Alphaproteobacteria bacterium]
MALYQILYTSNALRQMDMADLGRIEQVSVRNNRAAGVTGLLLYVGGNFLQYLEGSQAAVEGIYG